MSTTGHSAPFAGKSALIYGGARGIGRAVSLEFARRGARVAVADLDRAGADEAAAEIAVSGGTAIGLTCDVLTDAAVRETAEAAERRIGEIDIVMNNVGLLITGNPEDIPVTEWHRIMDVSYLAAVRSLDVFLPKMLARGSGHIVNTASFAGLYPYGANRIPYAAAKAAVVSLSENLALYLHPKGIRVSCLCPGPVMTRVMEGNRNWSENVPMRGPGAQFVPIAPEGAAATLADGMRDGKIIIPTHEGVWDVLRRWGAGPDAFIQGKIDEYAGGDYGLSSRVPAIDKLR